MALTVTSIRSLEALRDLREEWEALEAHAGSPLLGFAWFLSAAEALYDERQLRVAVARSGGVAVGIAPLVEEATEEGTRLTLLGTSRLFEPSGWLCASPHAARAIGDHAVSLGTPLLLERLPQSSELCQLLPRVGLSGVSICRRATPSLAVDTTGSWDAYYSRLSSHLSGNVNRHERKAQRLFGTVRVEQSEPEPGDVEALLTRFAALEATGWKGRGGSALGQQEPLMSFYRRYCGRAAARGELRVATLFFGADIAAMEIAVDAHGRRWQLKIAYQEQVAPFYPGLQLVRGSLRDAFHRQLTSYEFLGVAEAWEEKWQPETREYQKLLIYPPSVYGASALVRDLGVFAWRRAQQARAARTASVWWAGLGVESAVGA